MPRIFDEQGFAFTCPIGHTGEVTKHGNARAGAKPMTGPGTSPLAEALFSNCASVPSETVVDIVPDATPPTAEVAGAVPTFLSVDVPADLRDRSILLVERGGGLHWLGLGPAGTTESGSAVRHRIPLAGAAGNATGIIPDSPASSVLDRMVSYMRPPTRVHLFVWPDHRAMGLDGSGPGDHPALSTLWSASGPTPDGSRMLLLLPDLFSTSGELLNALETGEDPPALRRHYAAIVGYDGDALRLAPSVDGRHLTTCLLSALSSTNGTIDIIAHGRGGLVARTLMEDPELRLQFAERRIAIRQAVLVACPNGGTPYAAPNMIGDLLDIHTTLRASGLTETPERNVGGLPALGALICRLSCPGSEAADVAGLAALAPGSDDLHRLNAREPEPSAEPLYRGGVVRFDALGTGHGSPLATALARAAEQVTGASESDLLTACASMSDFGAASDRLTDQIVLPTMKFDRTAPFATPGMNQALATWLGLADAAVRPSVETPPSAGLRRHVATPVASPVRGMGAQPIAATTMRSDRTPLRSAERDDHRAGEATVGVEVAVPGAPAVGKPFALTIGLIGQQHSGRANGGDGVDLPLNSTLTVAATATGCGRILGADRLSGLRLPAERERETLVFQAVCDRPGRAEFIVEISEGAAQVFLRTLTVDAGGTATAPKLAKSAIHLAGEATGPVLNLRVTDRRLDNGDTELTYTATGAGLDIEDTVRLDGRTFERFVDDSFDDLETALSRYYSAIDLDALIHAYGVNLADTLLPPRLREAMWAQRRDFEAVHVVATEHRLPWEALFIDDPLSGSGDGGYFLAEKGLTRWLRHAPPPRRHGVLGPAIYVEPEYSKPLPSVRREIAAISDLLESFTRWPSRSGELIDLLKSASPIGVLHYAGHGNVSEEPVPSGQLLLGEFYDYRQLKTTYDYLPSSLVAANFRAADMPPIVFLNTCRAGRTAPALIGAAGYARAFIEPRSRRGALAFVGASWSIADAAGKAFAQTFYRELVGGTPLHAAATAARRDARLRSGDLTWLAYSVYGDPMARFTPD